DGDGLPRDPGLRPYPRNLHSRSRGGRGRRGILGPALPSRRPGAVQDRGAAVARPAPALLCGALRALLHLGRDRAYPEGACGPDGGMRITDAWLRDEGLQQVLQLLTDAGHLALLVGGCVRNALLGQPVADIDIATDAVPDRVIKVAGAA